MILFPAIDIKNGKCVRLTQGDYSKETIYSSSPVQIAENWEQKGAAYLHVVDLDGAKNGASANKHVISKIVGEVSIPVQIGGGIRSMETVEQYIETGVSRVIIGTAAINDRDFLKHAVNTYGEKIAVSIDARNGYVATNGWTETSGIKAVELVKELEAAGVKTIIYTDILKDGMLKGPNFKELHTINGAVSIDVIASGGVTTKEDIQQLKKQNLYGAIIGKALYDGTLSLEEALEGEANAG
jgi:phosphoribosylformimino-5-aminoimidazole carboxamide ribotide isomerase